MAELLREGPRLILRRAAEEDIDYICALQEDADNRDYIVPFTREEHTIIVTQAKAAIDIIVEERGSGERVGYLQGAGVDARCHRKEGARLRARNDEAPQGMGV